MADLIFVKENVGPVEHSAKRYLKVAFMKTLLSSALMLAIESNGVVGLRLLKLSRGGSDAVDEALLMVNEKVYAAIEAGASLSSGRTLCSVLDRYREHVEANSVRLLARAAADC